jgi:hypothetical protein
LEDKSPLNIQGFRAIARTIEAKEVKKALPDPSAKGREQHDS